MTKRPLQDFDVSTALRTIVEMTATETGHEFFTALVKNLALSLGTIGAWVTEYLPEQNRLRSLAFWLNDGWVEHYEYDVGGTPCEPVVEERKFFHVAENVFELFPVDTDLTKFNATSYMGAPLLDTDGSLMGHLAVIDRRPMPAEPKAESLFHIFAQRAAAELRRLRLEISLREREEKLNRLLNSAMDAIVELDQKLCVSRENPAAAELFGYTPGAMAGVDFAHHLEDDSASRLRRLIRELDTRPDGSRSTWIPGGLQAVTSDGRVFPAEATLSRFDLAEHPFHTLILRNVNDRLEAEKQIQTLAAQTEYLRQELEQVEGLGDIIGQSQALMRVLHDVQQVGRTDSTVLIQGETGTGKELVAHAIHRASDRRTKPFVKVNCAAIPANLIESEFFGHEKGAFTGATAKRDGRFALADGGTIFLDEVGELPIDLQAKLLRVLQEGEFEPVGSSQTRAVDVRVVAATNRDLERECKEGRYREDLYYRLSVFPIALPPLRERIEDIPLLAQAFVDRFAQRLGRSFAALSAANLRQLQAYAWPGNIRELQNVIERAIITAQDGQLNLDRALPNTDAATTPTSDIQVATDRIHTSAELQQLECDNIVRALDACGWRVSGESGAAALLGMRPSTLSSRMKALGISRPR